MCVCGECVVQGARRAGCAADFYPSLQSTCSPSPQKGKMTGKEKRKGTDNERQAGKRAALVAFRAETRTACSDYVSALDTQR